MQTGFTPLHLASSGGEVECARLLLDHKANVNSVNKVGVPFVHVIAFLLCCVNGIGVCVCVCVLIFAPKEM